MCSSDLGCNACLGNLVVALLERACGIDEQKGLVLVEDGSDVTIAIGSQCTSVRQMPGKGFRRLMVSPRNQNLETVAGQSPRQARAEATIAAKNEDFLQRIRSACSGVGSQQVSRLPKIR